MLRAGDEPIPGYVLKRSLGGGGFGVVWQARAAGVTDCALKIVPFDRKAGAKELRAIARIKAIRHANLLPINVYWLLDEFGAIIPPAVIDEILQQSLTGQTTKLHAQSLVMAMPLGDKSLLKRLEERQEEGHAGLPVGELLGYIEDAAKALDFLNSPLHDLGEGLCSIQHCDVKPANILLQGPSALVCDYSLARVIGAQGRTSTNGTEGTIAYLAPEVIAHARPSAHTDQYSLAVSYVELRTGRLPFGADTSVLEIMLRHREGNLDLSDLTLEEAEVIRRATSVEPSNRFPSMLAMAFALRQATHALSPGESSFKPRASWQAEATGLLPPTGSYSGGPPSGAASSGAGTGGASQASGGRSGKSILNMPTTISAAPPDKLSPRSPQFQTMTISGGASAVETPPEQIVEADPRRSPRPARRRATWPLALSASVVVLGLTASGVALQWPGLLGLNAQNSTPPQLATNDPTPVAVTPAVPTPTLPTATLPTLTPTPLPPPPMPAVEVAPPPAPPRLAMRVVDLDEQQVEATRELRVRLLAVDPNNPPGKPRFELVSPPPGVTLDALTGELRWTPESALVGVHRVKIRVSSTELDTPATETLLAINVQALTPPVAPVKNPPKLAILPPQMVEAGKTLRLSLLAIDPNTPAAELRYELGKDAPPDAKLNPTTGELSWETPASTSAGEVKIPLRVSTSDPQTPATESTLLVTVTAAPATPTPPITPTTLTTTPEPKPEIPAPPPEPPKLGDTLTNSLGMKLVYLTGGEFLMGAPESERGREKDETPHRVTLSKDFYLGKYEVTAGQFQKFTTATNFRTDAERMQGARSWDGEKFVQKSVYNWLNPNFPQTTEHPVVNVSWNDARAFADWLSRKENKTYRLPTEAEWEYACRAGTTTAYSNGDDPEALARIANIADVSARRRFPKMTWCSGADDKCVFTAPVGAFPANPWGLHDMHGNVWEWCADFHAEYPKGPIQDPWGSGQFRVYRGGGWDINPPHCRSANRMFFPEKASFSNLGFRLVLVP